MFKYLVTPLDDDNLPLEIDTWPDEGLYDDRHSAEAWMKMATYDNEVWGCRLYINGTYEETVSVAYGGDLWSK